MLRIIPTPAIIEERKGTFALSRFCAIEYGGEDGRINAALNTLLAEADCSPSQNIISVSHGNVGEGYRLTVGENAIAIEADGAAGAFYAIQSLRQLTKENGSDIPCCYIEDAPELSYRGFYHDISRGRVPTLKKLKTIADTLAFYKINSLQLYVEDAFTFSQLEGIVSAKNALTPDEIKELDRYCMDRFIDLVPSMSTI